MASRSSSITTEGARLTAEANAAFTAATAARGSPPLDPYMDPHETYTTDARVLLSSRRVRAMHRAMPLRPLPGAPHRRTPPGGPGDPTAMGPFLNLFLNKARASVRRAVAAETVAAAAEPSGATVPSESRSAGSTVTAFPKSLECGDGSWRTRRIEGPSSTIATRLALSTPSPDPPAAPPASSTASFAGVRRISAVSSHVPPRACTSSSNVARSPSSPTLS